MIACRKMNGLRQACPNGIAASLCRINISRTHSLHLHLHLIPDLRLPLALRQLRNHRIRSENQTSYRGGILQSAARPFGYSGRDRPVPNTHFQNSLSRPAVHALNNCFAAGLKDCAKGKVVKPCVSPVGTFYRADVRRVSFFIRAPAFATLWRRGDQAASMQSACCLSGLYKPAWYWLPDRDRIRLCLMPSCVRRECPVSPGRP